MKNYHRVKVKQFLFVIFLVINASIFIIPQTKDIVLFNKDEMENISKIYTSLEVNYNKMLEIKNEVGKDINCFGNMGWSLQKVKSGIDKQYKMLNTKNIIASICDSNYIDLTKSLIFKDELSYSIIDSNEFIGLMDGPIYVTAAGLDGQVFFLSGFHCDEFGKFLRSKIGKIENGNIAYNVSKMYLEIKIFLERNYLLIDSSNINNADKILNYAYPEKLKSINDSTDINAHKYHNKFISSIDSAEINAYKNNKLLKIIHPAKIIKIRNGYEITIFTLDRICTPLGKYAKLISHRFIINKNCKMKYSSRIIKY